MTGKKLCDDVTYTGIWIHSIALVKTVSFAGFFFRGKGVTAGFWLVRNESVGNSHAVCTKIEIRSKKACDSSTLISKFKA